MVVVQMKIHIHIRFNIGTAANEKELWFNGNEAPVPLYNLGNKGFEKTNSYYSLSQRFTEKQPVIYNLDLPRDRNCYYQHHRQITLMDLKILECFP
jgi:hypothetical protein